MREQRGFVLLMSHPDLSSLTDKNKLILLLPEILGSDSYLP